MYQSLFSLVLLDRDSSNHGWAADVIREEVPQSEVGIVLIHTPAYPATDSEADRDAFVAELQKLAGLIQGRINTCLKGAAQLGNALLKPGKLFLCKHRSDRSLNVSATKHGVKRTDGTVRVLGQVHLVRCPTAFARFSTGR